MKFALTSETSSALEICKGIYNGKNKRGKTVSLRSTIIRENANLNKHNFATKYRLVYDKLSAITLINAHSTYSIKSLKIIKTKKMYTYHDFQQEQDQFPKTASA